MNIIPENKPDSLFNAIVILLAILITGCISYINQPLVYLISIAICTMMVYLLYENFSPPEHHVVLFFLASSLLLPAIPTGGGIPDIRLEEIFYYGLFPIIILNYVNYNLKGDAKKFIYAIIIFMGFMLISTLYGRIFLNVPVIPGDIFNFFTIGKLILIFLVFYHFDYSKTQLTSLLYAIVILLTISGFIGIVQYYGVFGLNSILGNLYVPGKPYIVTQRLVGSFHNPNTFGFILTLAVIICTSLFFHEKHNTLRRVLLLLAIGYFIFLIFLTASRTALGTLIIVIISLPFYYHYKRDISLFHSLFFILIIGSCMGIIIGYLSYDILRRYISGLAITSDLSFLMRIIAWYLNFQIFLESPIIGWGPGQAIHSTVVDNQYLIIARRYGVIGLITHLFFYYYPVKLSFTSDWSRDSIEEVWNQVILFSLLTFLITNLSNQIFYEIQVMDFWMILMGIFFSINYSKNKSA
jgi:hypothetical protein